MHRVATIIPVYNEAETLAAVVKNIQASLPDVDIVVVDDGSTDDSARVAREAGATVLKLPYNLGIGGAVQTGYLWASKRGYDAVLRMDADGQHDPAWAHRLVDPVLDGSSDVVIGSRFLDPALDNHRPPPMRRFGIRTFSRLVKWLTGARITDPTSGFRCVSRDVASYSAEHHPQDFPEVESLVHYYHAGFRVSEMAVVMRDRSVGTSSIAGARTAFYAIKVTLALLLLTRPRRR